MPVNPISFYGYTKGFFDYHKNSHVFDEIKILTSLQTLAKIKKGQSLIRFGDGELLILNHQDVWFQKHDTGISTALSKIITHPPKNTLIAVPSILKCTRFHNARTRRFWYRELIQARPIWQKYLNNKITYGDAQVTRPYSDLKSRYHSEIFTVWKDIFAGRDILLVEGKKSKTGVSNDLFATAKSVRRIIAPSHDAFSRLPAIKSATKKAKPTQNTLLLFCLGPTAKILAADFVEQGFQCIDIGHLGQEYAFYFNKIPRRQSTEDYFARQTSPDYQKSIITEIK